MKMTDKYELSDSERDLLAWLSREDYSQYGECHGKSLDRLIELGFAQIHGPGEHQVFIAKGTGPIYRAVSLTDKGAALALIINEFDGLND